METHIHLLENRTGPDPTKSGGCVIRLQSFILACREFVKESTKIPGRRPEMFEKEALALSSENTLTGKEFLLRQSIYDVSTPFIQAST